MMMKVLLFCFLASISLSLVNAECHTTLRCYEVRMNKLLNQQIKVQLRGHYTYLYLANVFMRNNLYYPKAAKFFREKANEEMQHAERFIEYQNQRGGLFNISDVERKRCGINSLQDGFVCARKLEISVTRSLTKLLKDVSDVQPVVPATRGECDDISPKRRDLIMAQPILITYEMDGETSTEPLATASCAGYTRITKVEYVELATMITHEFLGRQIEDTKELANFESTLERFENQNIGAYLVDKEL